MIYKKEYKEKNKEKRHCAKVPAEKSIDFRPKEEARRAEKRGKERREERGK